MAVFLKMAEERLDTDINENDNQRIADSGMPENIQKATQFVMSVFNGEQTAVSLPYSEILGRNTASWSFR